MHTLDSTSKQLANLCWSVTSLAKDFCTDLFGVGINQKIEVRRTETSEVRFQTQSFAIKGLTEVRKHPFKLIYET